MKRITFLSLALPLTAGIFSTPASLEPANTQKENAS